MPPKQEGLDLAFYRVIALPFLLESEGKHAEAIESYGKAQDILNTLTTEHRSGMRKAVRKVFEHQAKVLGARKEYLSQLSRENRLGDAVPPPTALSLNRALEDDTIISHAQKRLSGAHPPANNKTIDLSSDATNQIPTSPLSASLSSPSGSTSSPVGYEIDHKSELVFLGERTQWFFVRDPSTKQVHWVMRALWSNDVPIVEAVLCRAGEIMPGAGAVHVDILKQSGGAFNLRMQSLSTGWVLEVPDRAQHKKDWSPRRFWYGGRLFVWKEEGLWETLYEISKVTNVEGSRTGKKMDEVVGEKLCWGERPSKWKLEAKIWFRAGLDQGFVEHCLASQLARWMRQANPPAKDTRGIEAAGAATGLLSLITELS